MKKVGIITINDNKNYGNKLQNYATQEILKGLGLEVVTILNSPYNNATKYNRIKKTLQMPIHLIIKKGLLKIKNSIFPDKLIAKTEELNLIKIDNFRRFILSNINETQFIITPDYIPRDKLSSFDAFVVGSDQVWNPYFRVGSPIDFLTFTSPDKRIAYAASFGVSDIPIELKKNYKDWLSEMAHISVREETGAEIIEELTGRKVEVIVDPTLMLTSEDWLSISKPAKDKLFTPYLLTYFLGEVSSDVKAYIDSITSPNNLEVINLADINDEQRYVADPAEFLDYIISSDVFLTDSFHGVIFSIIFQKPFIVFDRVSKSPSMNSRINTLLKKFCLTNRHIRNLSKEESIFQVDFSHVPSILTFEREKALQYLEKALNIDDKG